MRWARQRHLVRPRASISVGRWVGRRRIRLDSSQLQRATAGGVCDLEPRLRRASLATTRIGQFTTGVGEGLRLAGVTTRFGGAQTSESSPGCRTRARRFWSDGTGADSSESTSQSARSDFPVTRHWSGVRGRPHLLDPTARGPAGVRREADYCVYLRRRVFSPAFSPSTPSAGSTRRAPERS